MWLKFKAVGAFILAILTFLGMFFSFRAGKKSERLDQEEANNKAQREVTKAVAEGNEQYQEKVDEARNTNAKSDRFTK